MAIGQVWDISIYAIYTGVSVNLGNNTGPAPVNSAYPEQALLQTKDKTFVLDDVQAQNFAFGGEWKAFESEFYDKIIVTPRISALGFVLSSKTIVVEVWNSFSSRSKTLTAINDDSSRGITVADPYGVPLHYAGTLSKTYSINVVTAGPANINDVITWVFSGVTGTDLTITGVRILPFTVSPNWDDGIDEGLEYLTDILNSWNDTEQRIQLLNTPKRSIEFTPMAMEQRESAWLQNQLEGWGSSVFGVPWWMQVTPLNADFAINGQVISVTTDNKDFSVGGLVLVWENFYTWEVYTITAVTSSSITTDVKAGRTFQRYKSWVIPMRVCRIGTFQGHEFFGRDYAKARIKFTSEPLQ